MRTQPSSSQDPGALRPALWIFILVAATLTASLLLPAVYVPESHGFYGNQETVLAGWAALMGAVIFPAVFYLWAPNVPLAVGMFLLLARRWRGAMLCGAIALGLAAANWLIVVNFFSGDEENFKPLPGYYLWMASMAELAVGSWYYARNLPKGPVGRVRAFLIGALLGMAAGMCGMLIVVIGYIQLVGVSTARREWFDATGLNSSLEGPLSAGLGAIAGLVIGGISGVVVAPTRRAKGTGKGAERP